MDVVRLAILVSRWQSRDAGRVAPQPFTLDEVQDLFDGPHDWSLSEYWRKATLGHLSLTATVFDIGPLGLALPAAADPSKDPKRADIISNAVWTATFVKGVQLGPFDGVVVWLDGPCGAGALPRSVNLGDGKLRNAAVFDAGAGLTYYQHEIGHVLGFPHSLGPPVPALDEKTGAQLKDSKGQPLFTKEYQDNACIMSAFTFGGLPAATKQSAQPGIGTDNRLIGHLAWQSMGPLPAAASVYLWANTNFRPHSAPTHEFDRSVAVRDLGLEYLAHPCDVEISSFSQHATDGPVLVTLKAEGTRWFIELRTAHRWDFGLPPGIYVHRHETGTSANPFFEPGAERMAYIPLDAADRDWTSPEGEFSVTVGPTSKRRGVDHVRLTLSAGGNPPTVVLQNVTASGPDVLLLRLSETIPDGCMVGTYNHMLMGRSTRIEVTARGQLPDPSSFSWTVDGQAVGEVPATLTLAPAMAEFPPYPSVIDPGKPIVPPKIAELVAHADASMLVLEVAAATGRFDVRVQCTVRNGVGAIVAQATKTAAVPGPWVEDDKRWLDKAKECLKASIADIDSIDPHEPPGTLHVH